MSPRRSGMTLIELLIAVTLTLVIIVVMVRAFKLTSDEIGIGRAKMDMHNQLRTVTETLRRDLQLATCSPRPRGLNDERTGYFEYVEGEEFDRNHMNMNTNSFVGDHDDVLSLTVRSDDKPFRGRFNNGFVESNLAEICWWIVHDDTNGDGEVQYDENVRLYRRVLLIRPDLAPLTSPPAEFFEANDISARQEAGNMVPNSLDQLANRRNRYSHDGTIANFPHELQANWLSERVLGIDGGDGVPIPADPNPNREGEDLMLSDCVAFDIKIFDPNSEVANIAGTDYLLDSNDPGFNPDPVSMPITSTGGYVDLGFGVPFVPVVLNGWFADNATPATSAPASVLWTANTWCSWFAGYESDGIDQNVDTIITDEGANGVDDDGLNGIDDNAERETQPPYPYPIRSIQISVRMIEKKTNQILQKTIKESFVPN